MRSAALLAALVVGATPVLGQGGPPPPLPMKDVSFPAFHERTLSNGALLLVVPQREVPFVTVNVVVPGGTAFDPPDREGVATFVAELLDRGTAGRSADEIAATLDRLGISFGAEASEEWSTVSLNAVTPAFAEGLGLLADLVMNPTFSEEPLEETRTRARTGLQVQGSRPSSVADRTFLRALYGDHPYGRMPTPGSVSRLTRYDLERFHETWYRPDGALVVVSGDVDPEDVTRKIEEAFRGWEPAVRPELPAVRAPDRIRPEVVVVHQPGAAQAEIRIGHLLVGGDVDGWEELVVANQILGGGPPGRLQQVLRGALGYTYDVRSTLTRGRRLGVFRITTATRHEVAADAVEEILEQVERLRSRETPEGELDDKVSYLVGSFPLSVETPQQVAGQVTTHRLLGLPPEELERYRSRIEAVDTAAARSAAERWIRPEQFLIVVAGDAAVLQPRLRALGEVAIVDAAGTPLSMGDLTARPSDETFDLSDLQPATLTYAVLAGGAVRGRAVRTLEAVAEGWRFASVIEAGPQRLEQQVVVDEALQLVSSHSSMASAGHTLSVEARRVGDRIEGAITSAGPPVPVDMSAPAGVTLSDGLELALWASDLSVGREIRLPVADVQGGSVDNVVLRVEEETEITVPAGTFPVFRVSVTGRDPQTFFVRIEAPHIPVRMESASRPVALELIEVGRRW